MDSPFNAVEWQDADAKRCLELGGSKAGGYHFLTDKMGFAEHLPTGTVDIRPREDAEQHLSKMIFRRKKIVRAYHPLDVFGMVDILETSPPVNGREAVRDAIHRVLTHAQRDDVRAFVEYEFGQPFDGKVGVLIHDYNEGPRGSILEHPHEQGMYRVGLTTPLHPNTQAHMQKMKAVLEEEVCTSDGKAIDPHETMNTGGQVLEESQICRINEIIDFYRRLRDSGLMPHTHSFQMEFGFDDITNAVLFYQARLFKVFSPRADFSPQQPRNWRRYNNHLVLPYSCYGVTPEEGVTLPLGFLETEGVMKRQKDSQAAYMYANTNTHESTDLSIRPTNIAAYIACSGLRQLLPHGHYRWMQKAPVTIMIGNDGDLIARNRRGSLRRVRIISNGVNGLLVYSREKR